MVAKLNTNDESCTTHFVQHAGVEGIRGDQTECMAMLDVLKERRDAAVDIISTIPGMSVSRPEATFYLFPDVTDSMQRMGFDDVARFVKPGGQMGCPASSALSKIGGAPLFH